MNTPFKRSNGRRRDLAARLHRAALLPLLLALCFTTISCSPETIAPPDDAVTIRGAGATFPAALYKHWFQQYMSTHDGVVVTYDVVGSGAGERRFIGKHAELTEADLVDFGASDAGLTDEQIADVDRGAVAP